MSDAFRAALIDLDQRFHIAGRATQSGFSKISLALDGGSRLGFAPHASGGRIADHGSPARLHEAGQVNPRPVTPLAYGRITRSAHPGDGNTTKRRKVVVCLRLSVLEQRLTSRAFALALDPLREPRAASRELVALAAGDRRALERVFDRVRAAADPRGQVTSRVLATLQAALAAVEPAGPRGPLTAAPAGSPAAAAETGPRRPRWSPTPWPPSLTVTSPSP